jgi:hypothetical protein
MKKKPIVVTGWIVRASLSDGRTVNLDLEDEAAQAVDSFISDIEKGQDWEEWIVDEV